MTDELESWVIVRTVGTEEEAALLEGFLREHEIPAQIESLIFHQEPVTFGHVGEVRIRVPELHADRARGLLEQGDPLVEGEGQSGEGSEA